MSAHIPLLTVDIPPLDALLPYLERIGRSGIATNRGTLVLELEGRLGAALGCPVTAIANGTLALELAIGALGLEPGSYIACPALTFPASATAIVRAGHQPYFVDVDPQTWCIATKGFSFPGDEVSAVMTVSAFGSGAGATQELANAFPLVVDAAPAWGNQAALKGALTCYSMHATKGLVAGEGGFIACHEPGAHERIRSLSNFGIGSALKGGTNAKMSEYAAAVGLASLDSWPGRSCNRGWGAAYYHGHLISVPGLSWQEWSPDWTRTIFPVLLREGSDVVRVAAALAAQGVESRRWYHPLVCDMPAFAQYPCASIPVARSISDRLLGLPFFTGISEAQMSRVAQALKEVLAATAT